MKSPYHSILMKKSQFYFRSKSEDFSLNSAFSKFCSTDFSTTFIDGIFVHSGELNISGLCHMYDNFVNWHICGSNLHIIVFCWKKSKLSSGQERFLFSPWTVWKAFSIEEPQHSEAISVQIWQSMCFEMVCKTQFFRSFGFFCFSNQTITKTTYSQTENITEKRPFAVFLP